MIKLQLHPDARILRQFAWVSLVAFPLIGWVLLYLTLGLSPLWILVLAGIGLAVLLSELIGFTPLPRFVFRALVLLSWPIGLVVFTLLIGLIYYGVFTPMGLFFRLIGRDVLHKKPDPAVASYWHERGPERPPASYFKLY